MKKRLDCPKCIGKLQPFTIKLYDLDIEDIREYIPLTGLFTAKVKDPDWRGFNGLKKSGRIELDKCFVCSGMWFDKGELKKVIKENPKKRTLGSYIHDSKIYKQLNAKSGLCPRCRVPMRKLQGKNRLKKTTIDVCPKCRGTWLDGGEINYLLKGHKEISVNAVFRHFNSSYTKL